MAAWEAPPDEWDTLSLCLGLFRGDLEELNNGSVLRQNFGDWVSRLLTFRLSTLIVRVRAVKLEPLAIQKKTGATQAARLQIQKASCCTTGVRISKAYI